MSLEERDITPTEAVDHWTVDTDVHYLDTLSDLAEYFDDDDPWSRKFERGNAEAAGGSGIFPTTTGDRFMYGKIKRDVNFPEGPRTEEHIDRLKSDVGADQSILLSHQMLMFNLVAADDRRQTVYARKYVDYLRDHVVDPANGIFGVVPLPYQEPAAAAEILDEVKNDRGIVGGCMITSGAEPPLGNRKYEVIYETAEAADLPIIFHTGGSGLNEYHIRGYEEFIETHALGFVVSNMSQLTSLLMQGIPEKFPDLDVIFQESGLFWIPMMMYRLDSEYMKRPSEAPMLDKRPSEYVRDNFYFGTQPIEDPVRMDFLEQIIEMIGGADRLMYASDYPHWDYDPPSSIDDLPFLSEPEKAKILGGNAQAVFDI